MDARGFPVAESWFSIRQVADGITQVTEPHVNSLIRANFYHVHGSEADLVVDTGTGIAPLPWVLGRLMDAPKRLITVATHTHYDHVGGIHECRERLVHPREQSSLAGNGQFASLFGRDFPLSWRSQVEDGDHQLPEVLVDAIPFEGFDPRDYTFTPTAATRLVEEGDRIALGGREFEVMHTPGHSPGGICLLDRKAGVLFSGDTIYDSRLFDELPGSNIDSYVKTIGRLRAIAAEVRIVCPGHEGCFDGGRLRELCDAYLNRRGQAGTATGPE